MRNIKFSPEFFQEYITWYEIDRNIFNNINELIKDVLRNPSKGLGKPELWKGCFSRRITDEHMLVYRIEYEAIWFIKCHGHYN